MDYIAMDTDDRGVFVLPKTPKRYPTALAASAAECNTGKFHHLWPIAEMDGDQIVALIHVRVDYIRTKP